MMLGQRSFLCVPMLLSMIAHNLEAALVVDGNIEWGPASPGNYGSTIYQDLEGDYTSTWFDFDHIALSIRAVSFNLDEGSDWYLVRNGDELSHRTLAQNSFPVILVNGDFQPRVTISMPDLYFGVFPEFYLGAVTGMGFMTDPPFNPNRNVFGWIKLRRIGFGSMLYPYELEVIESAVAYDTKGIIVGTRTTIPEPSSLNSTVIAMFCVALLLYRNGFEDICCHRLEM